MSYLTQPLNGVPAYFPYGFIQNPVVAPGSTDAIPVADSTIFITSAGVNAMTLGNPVAGVYPAGSKGIQALGNPNDDGKSILIIATTAQLHTLTTATNKINGNKHIATWAAAVGNNIWLIAYNGIWYVAASLGITLT